MIIIDNIGNLKECKVWLNESPLEKFEVSNTLSSLVKHSHSVTRNNQSIAVELFVAPRYYAFLGVDYIYKKTKDIEIIVNVAKKEGRIITDSLALPSDNVNLGISDEYAQTILNTSLKVCKNLSNIPSGVLIFNVGAHSDYGSNQVIFSKVTSILMRLFDNDQSKIEITELKSIIQNELNKPLTDI